MAYKRFPPGRGHVLLPMSSRAGARAGLSLYAACKPSVLRLQRFVELWVTAFGARWLPGPTTELQPPMTDDTWHELIADLAATTGRFDDMAVYSRRQEDRSGFGLLLLSGGRPTAFVKIRSGTPKEFDVETAALKAMQHIPTSFVVPRIVARGEQEGFYWLATSALPGRVHRPPRRADLDQISGDLQRGLHGWHRPQDVPGHWRPMHGDFAPWNLRELADGRLALIDWEDVSWGPPGADVVYYWGLATAMGLRCTASPDMLTPEAARFWHGRVAQRQRELRDPRLWQNAFAAWRKIAQADGRMADRTDI